MSSASEVLQELSCIKPDTPTAQISQLVQLLEYHVSRASKRQIKQDRINLVNLCLKLIAWYTVQYQRAIRRDSF